MAQAVLPTEVMVEQVARARPPPARPGRYCALWRITSCLSSSA